LAPIAQILEPNVSLEEYQLRRHVWDKIKEKEGKHGTFWFPFM
jgi:hypothetical protein